MFHDFELEAGIALCITLCQNVDIIEIKKTLNQPGFEHPTSILVQFQDMGARESATDVTVFLS